jgi:diaminopimelate epimerase
MRFTKMQGAGNDYVYVDGFREVVRDPAEVARRISDRHFGVGSDGLIIIRPPDGREADCRMEMYNADGSRGQMCGNGIRCVAKYVHDHGIRQGSTIRIETDAGLKTVRLVAGPDGLAREIEVDMGAPRLERRRIPLVDGGDPEAPAIGVPIEVAGRRFQITAVSMGNPHAVVRLLEPPADPPLASWPLAEIGPRFEHHPWFPERVNTEFVVMRSPAEMDFRVWERGSGETLACGTGACAAVVAGVLNGWCDHEVIVHLLGGDLRIRWEDPRPDPRTGMPGGGRILMTGPAVEVFTGDWPD